MSEKKELVYELYSIKDVVTGTFNDLKIFPNEASAVRYFDGLCQESKIKNDLQLFKLGSYDVLSGAIVPCVEFIKAGSENE